MCGVRGEGRGIFFCIDYGPESLSETGATSMEHSLPNTIFHFTVGKSQQPYTQNHFSQPLREPSIDTVSTSDASVFGPEGTEDGNEDAETVSNRKERRKWTPTEDGVLISAWLNTSKDPVVGNEQKANAFWQRIAAYFAASPKLAGLQKRDRTCCKQRWAKINEAVSRFVGCYVAATKQRSSGQNEDDVLKIAHQIFYNDYKVKFTMEHAWLELRHDQKWCGASTDKVQGKRRKLGDQGSQSATYGPGNHVEDEARPVGVKASKAKGKSSVSKQASLEEKEKERKEFQNWKNCPTAWKGQYTRGSGKPTIVLEAVASQDLWIWHAFFGPPGTLNDINVLDRSPVFDDILQGRAPKVNYIVNGHEYHLAYYLTDGIYPKWATFVQSIPLPQGPKATLFATHQEAVRKDVERAFGVLQARFAIVKNPALLWDKIKIGKIMRACIILHNMIVEDERDGYTHFDVSVFEQPESNRSSEVDFTFSTDMPSNLGNMMAIRNQIRDRKINQQLKADLVENIWQKFGANGDFN
uniref:Myb-like domain-containing protein n=1 Tax=Brassica oleracea var. oleracea TaxID=109376 RepID=A0A0D3CZB4_BRAOL